MYYYTINQIDQKHVGRTKRVQIAVLNNCTSFGHAAWELTKKR